MTRQPVPATLHPTLTRRADKPGLLGPHHPGLRRYLRQVGVIARRSAVALELAVDRRGIPAEAPRHLGDADARRDHDLDPSALLATETLCHTGLLHRLDAVGAPAIMADHLHSPVEFAPKQGGPTAVHRYAHGSSAMPLRAARGEPRHQTRPSQHEHDDPTRPAVSVSQPFRVPAQRARANCYQPNERFRYATLRRSRSAASARCAGG